MTALEVSLRMTLLPYVGAMSMDKFDAMVEAVASAARLHRAEQDAQARLNGEAENGEKARSGYALGEGE